MNKAKLLLIISILTICQSMISYAAKENYLIGINGLELASIADDEIPVNLELIDPLFNEISIDNEDMQILNSAIYTKLWYEDVNMDYWIEGWSVEVGYHIDLIDPFFPDDIVSHYDVLIVDYNPSSGYNPIQLKEYPGFHIANVTIDVVNIIGNIDLPEDLRFDLILETERIYNVELDNSPIAITVLDDCKDEFGSPINCVSGNVLNSWELPIVWDLKYGAESYDVEWLFIDLLHSQFDETSVEYAENPLVDFRNATRVNVKSNSFRIPLGFPEGYVVIRVRPVGVAVGDTNIIKEGTWSYWDNGDFGWPLLSEAQDEPGVVFAYDGLESGLNWSYSSAFAEDGKTFQTLSFYDGSLRAKQSLSLLNSDNKIMVGESYYDFQGRPAIQVIPSPTENKGLKFYDGFNGVYDKDDFAVDYNHTEAMTPNLNEEGTHNYFSPLNLEWDGLYEEYLPNAEGYPFSRTLYSNDGTGRVVAQTLPGASHQLAQSDDHASRVYYTVPTQEELDRLFGNEVGYAEHYQKIVSKDANGQLTSSYLDQEGRVIATALYAGESSKTNYLDINNRPLVDEITSNLLHNNTPSLENGTRSVISSTTFTIPVEDERTLNYTVEPGMFNACNGSSVDFQYYLTISVKDEFMNEMSFPQLPDNLLIDQYTAALDIQLNFLPGTYYVEKKLILDNAFMDAQLDEIEARISGFHPVLNDFGSDHGDYIDLSFENEYGIIPSSSWQVDYIYEDLLTGVASDVTPLYIGQLDNIVLDGVSQSRPIMIGQDADLNTCVSFQLDIPVCGCDPGEEDPDSDLFCDPVEDVVDSPGEAVGDCLDTYFQMLSDVSPGGQYFDNLPATQVKVLGTYIDNEYYDSHKNAWLNQCMYRDYYVDGNNPEDEIGTSDDQDPYNGPSTNLRDYIDDPSIEAGFFWQLALYNGDGEDPMDPPPFVTFDELRDLWYGEWNERWPLLAQNGIENSLEFREVLDQTYLEPMDDLFHLHPEAIQYARMCDYHHIRHTFDQFGEPDFDEGIDEIANGTLPKTSTLVWEEAFLNADEAEAIQKGFFYPHKAFFRPDVTTLFDNPIKYVQEFENNEFTITPENVDISRLDAYLSMNYTPYNTLDDAEDNGSDIDFDCIDFAGIDGVDYYCLGHVEPLRASNNVGYGSAYQFRLNGILHNYLPLNTYTQEFHDTDGNPYCKRDYLSIYAVLDDPLGIASWNTVLQEYNPVPADYYDFIGQEQIDVIRTIHDSFRNGQSTKWEFFRSSYLHYSTLLKMNLARDFSSKRRIDFGEENFSDFIAMGDPSLVYLTEYNRYVPYGGIDGYNLHFPQISIMNAGETYNDASVFQNWDECYTGNNCEECQESLEDLMVNMTPVLVDQCEMTCQTIVDNYLYELYQCIGPLDPEVTSDVNEYNGLEELLLLNCSCSCHEAWDNADVLTDVVVDYYSCSSESTFDAIVSNYALMNGYDLTECIVEEDGLVYENNSSEGVCACGNLNDYVYYNYFDVFTSDEDWVLTEEEYNALSQEEFLVQWNGDYPEVANYIDPEILKDEFNNNDLFNLGGITYTGADISNLIVACEENKGCSVDIFPDCDCDLNVTPCYCSEGDIFTSCFENVITGVTVGSGYYSGLKPLPEAFYCGFSEVVTDTQEQEYALQCKSLWENEIDAAYTNYLHQVDEIMEAYLTYGPTSAVYEPGNFLVDEEEASGYILNYNETIETFTMSYELDEYLYTLYYYDQAGNLVNTVPPEGVEILVMDEFVANGNGRPLESIESVQEFRENNNNTFIRPPHRLVTNYKYNSYNQLRESSTPDGGTSYYFYDALGRLIVSQNAKQASATSPRYSYTIYDALGRPEESGEVVYDLDQNINQSITSEWKMTDLKNWVNSSILIKERTRSFYDEESNLPEISNAFPNENRHLRNRVAGITFVEEFIPLSSEENYESGSFYSYDIHGNVKSMIKVNKALEGLNQHIKRLDYEYDLVSGNTLSVTFQKDKWDQFIHKYEYDADNRLTYTLTSYDGRNWTKESKNLYYEHGSLARTEIGNQNVQANDFTYTIQGWLKGVNSPTIHANRDVGLDGLTDANNLNSHFGQDAFGYALDYYDGDYSSINGVSRGNQDYFLPNDEIIDNTDVRFNYNMFNGNISRMIYSLSGGGDMETVTNNAIFRYDQLNRIRSFDVYSADILSMTGANNLINTTNDEGVYHTDYEFDYNGNITNLNRNGDEIIALDMDAFSYDYNLADANGINKLVSNKLNFVLDASNNADTYDLDLDGHIDTALDPDPENHNYVYDEIGQLLEDKNEHIGEIVWTVTGKVKEIKRNFTEVLDEYPPNVEFFYDETGMRIGKVVKNWVDFQNLKDKTKWNYSYYVHDASGNQLSFYESTIYPSEQEYYNYKIGLEQTSINIFGNKRLGETRTNRSVKDYFHFDSSDEYFTYSGSLVEENGDLYESSELGYTAYNAPLGLRSYELADHRGNVYNTVSDLIAKTDDGNGSVDVARGKIITATDYYPYGMPMPGRSFTAENGSRYGFQGQETDDEIRGKGNSVNYKYRMHDARIGRFFAVDPLAAQYPHNSVYAFSENVVIDHIELEGLEKVDSDKAWNLTKDKNSSASGNYSLYTDDSAETISGTVDGSNVTLKKLLLGANKGNFIGYFEGNEGAKQGDLIVGSELVSGNGFNISSSNASDPAYAQMMTWNSKSPLLLSEGDLEIVHTPYKKYGIENYGQRIEFITFDTYGYHDWDYDGAPYIRLGQEITDYKSNTSSSLNLDSYSLAIGSGILKGSKLFQFGKLKPSTINTGNNTVYTASSGGNTIYVGITNNFARRSGEHADRFIIKPLLQNLSRYDARAVEQVLINSHILGKHGGTLLNKINSIAKTNPIYAESLKRGKEILDSINYAY